MRQTAIGEGDKRSVRERGLRANVLAREMDEGRNTRQWQMIVKKRKKTETEDAETRRIKEDKTKP